MRRTGRKMILLAGVALWLAMAGGAFGQTIWQTTKTEVSGFNSGGCGLERGQLRVKVYPAYLEVEEDLEISANGVVAPGNDANTLEIVGNFSLPDGAAITGSLLWDGDRILEGKLLDRKTADSLYESMVERNSVPPPRPRDPLILELTGKDAYRLRIYPVRLGQSRHVRLRYQLPPRIGQEGLEMALQAAAGTLFPGDQSSLPLTLEGGGDISKTVLVEGAGRTTLQLPRTRFVKVADLGPGWFWNPWDVAASRSLRVLPLDPLHQVMVRTRFQDGNFAGHYLNLYAGVEESVGRALGQRIEVVVLWKWHNPGTWIRATPYGYEEMPSVWQAQSQAQTLLALHDNMGGPGMRFGLLHDDSKTAVKAFRAAGRGEEAYVRSGEYLRSMQGAYVEDFARGIRLASGGKANVAAGIGASKDKFKANLRLVKTLYSPETGVVRHLLLISAGSDYVVSERDMNDAFADAFDDLPVSVGQLGSGSFTQAGFDFWDASRVFPYRGSVAETPWGPVPALAPLSLTVVVRNERRAYDFNIHCEGGLALNCGTLTFHGKSDTPWKDSLEWEAYDPAGKLLASAKTKPAMLGGDGDTAIAILWAGSSMPFSEKKELPLGPVFGFVDRWASILALEKDTLNRDRNAAYADSGVPRIANKELADVIPNYQSDQAPGGGVTTGIASATGMLGNPAEWKLERAVDGMFLLRIPGLAGGMRAKVALFDLHGRRLGDWILVSGAGALRWSPAGAARGGVFLLTVEVAGLSATKRIAL